MRLNSRVPILVIACWMILYLYRPFVLGFYLDDWWSLLEPARSTTPFSLDRLQYFVGFGTNYGPRPLLGFLAFLVTSLAGTAPAALQFISALLVLAAALSLRAWLNRVMSVFPAYRSILGDFAVILWLALPGMTGVTAWPMVAHNLAAQIVFTETARLLLARERITAGLAALVAAGIIASGLIYEAFYFAIFPVVLFYAICGRGPAKNKRDVALLLGICGFAQAIPIAFNRYAAHLHAAVTKTFNSGWPKLVVRNLLSLPNTLLNTFHEFRLLGLILVMLVVVCALVLWNKGRHRERLFYTYLVGLVGIAAAMLLLCVAVYSVAGYGFEPLGAGSRSLLVPSFAATVAFFSLICGVLSPGAKMVKAGLLAAAGALVVVLALAQHHRVDEWAHVWKEEVRILNGAPLNDIASLPPDAAVFYIGPSDYRGMVIFDAPWDLTAAVSSRRPVNQKTRPYEGLTRIYPASTSRWTWDGATLVRASRFGVERFEVMKLYAWREGVQGLQPLDPEFRWPDPAR